MKSISFLNAAAVATVFALGLSGCGLPQAQSDQVTQVLTQLTDTAIADMQTGKKLSLAATPPDSDGAMCFGNLPDPAVAGDTGSGGLGVAYALQKLAAAQKGQTVGALTAAEFASIVQPGSAQWNWAVKTLEMACIAKVHDTNQAINSTAGVFTAIPAILGLAALPAGS